MKDVIQAAIGAKVMLVDSAREVAKEARIILDAGGLLNRPGRAGKHRFYVSDEPARFVKMAQRFLKRRISCARSPE